MKNALLLLLVLAGIMIIACNKEEEEVQDPYTLLTAHVWVSDSLLANGVEAGGPGQLLEKFNGDVEFRTDGTGTFGEYSGTWSLSEDNTTITIVTQELPISIIAIIKELTTNSLKIVTGFPDTTQPGEIIDIRMTFKVK